MEGKTKVVFSAVLEESYADHGPYDQETTVTFNNVCTNIGDAYNSCTGKTKVVFSAVLEESHADHGPYDKETTVAFNKVYTNIGDAYNSCTGVFVAPVAGVYNFSIFYHGGGIYETGLQLFKNCQMMAKTVDHKSSSDLADNGGNAVNLLLQKGDEVSVHMSANTQVWAKDNTTTFSGFLICEI